MSTYPTDLQREVDRRWLHRFTAIDNSVPVGRPKHPNDIRPLPERPRDGTKAPQKSKLSEGDRAEQEPSRREHSRHHARRDCCAALLKNTAGGLV